MDVRQRPAFATKVGFPASLGCGGLLVVPSGTDGSNGADMPA